MCVTGRACFLMRRFSGLINLCEGKKIWCQTPVNAQHISRMICVEIAINMNMTGKAHGFSGTSPDKGNGIGDGSKIFEASKEFYPSEVGFVNVDNEDLYRRIVSG